MREHRVSVTELYGAGPNPSQSDLCEVSVLVRQDASGASYNLKLMFQTEEALALLKLMTLDLGAVSRPKQK
jgi:hypothetical protein